TSQECRTPCKPPRRRPEPREVDRCPSGAAPARAFPIDDPFFPGRWPPRGGGGGAQRAGGDLRIDAAERRDPGGARLVYLLPPDVPQRTNRVARLRLDHGLSLRGSEPDDPAG